MIRVLYGFGHWSGHGCRCKKVNENSQIPIFPCPKIAQQNALLNLLLVSSKCPLVRRWKLEESPNLSEFVGAVKCAAIQLPRSVLSDTNVEHRKLIMYCKTRDRRVNGLLPKDFNITSIFSTNDLSSMKCSTNDLSLMCFKGRRRQAQDSTYGSEAL